MCGTILGYHATDVCLRACYATFGTDLSSLATAISLRARQVLTEPFLLPISAYARAMRCPGKPKAITSEMDELDELVSPLKSYRGACRIGARQLGTATNLYHSICVHRHKKTKTHKQKQRTCPSNLS
eukprot:84189-Rhodomonas_salina.3